MLLLLLMPSLPQFQLPLLLGTPTTCGEDGHCRPGGFAPITAAGKLAIGLTKVKVGHPSGYGLRLCDQNDGTIGDSNRFSSVASCGPSSSLSQPGPTDPPPWVEEQRWSRQGEEPNPQENASRGQCRLRGREQFSIPPISKGGKSGETSPSPVLQNQQGSP